MCGFNTRGDTKKKFFFVTTPPVTTQIVSDLTYLALHFIMKVDLAASYVIFVCELICFKRISQKSYVQLI